MARYRQLQLLISERAQYQIHNQYIRQQQFKYSTPFQQQKMFCTITPQKRSTLNFINEDSLLRQLSPFPQCLSYSSRKKNPKIQLIQSPIVSNQDLFSQLLISEVRVELGSAYQSQMMEEEMYEQMDQIDQTCSKEKEQEQPQSYHDIDDQSSENGMRKRKRKSTAQIKILKKQLDLEANWSKEKIAQMSQTTGLSQAQVYKWWWDQKKKNQKVEKLIMTQNMRTKLIKKKIYKKDSKENVEISDEQLYQIEESAVATKIKANIQFDEVVPETERKINKRLVFF